MVVLIWGVGVAVAQTAYPRTERAHPQRAAQDEKNAKDTPQQRRAAVRAALEQREAKDQASDERPLRGLRQLTERERQELRQQLRQQRNDTARP